MESCVESKKQGRISIIMPVYNGVSWIGECIESIRQQTDTNWELLVLDAFDTFPDPGNAVVNRHNNTDPSLLF